MGQQLWVNPLATALADGPTLVAAAAASCLPTAARCTLPPGPAFWYPGKQLRLTASGRISCTAGAPGTARFDLRFGTIIVFDSQPIALNVAGKVAVGWRLDLLLTCRTVGGGNAATLIGQGTWTSEAGIGAPAVHEMRPLAVRRSCLPGYQNAGPGGSVHRAAVGKHDAAAAAISVGPSVSAVASGLTQSCWPMPDCRPAGGLGSNQRRPPAPTAQHRGSRRGSREDLRTLRVVAGREHRGSQ